MLQRENLRIKDELDKRKKKWKPIKPHYTKGVLAKYASLVSSATEGAVTSPRSLTFYKFLSSIDGNLMNFSILSNLMTYRNIMRCFECGVLLFKDKII